MSDEQTPQKSKVRRWQLSRRGFLIGLGATGATVGVGLAVGMPYARLSIANSIDAGNGSFSNISAPPSVWFEIQADNTVLFFTSKVEMGQGVHTTLAQIAADELEISFDQLQVVQANTQRGFNDGAGTGNSDSTSSSFLPIREAAATLREMLRGEAARRLGVATADLDAVEGTFRLKSAPDTQITYGDVVGGADLSSWEVPEEVPPLKPASEFRYIGQSVPRVDFKDKLIGQAVYGYDARVPNMGYGAIARPSVLNATLRRAAAGDAANAPGIISVVTEDDFAGVVAESRTQAYQAVNQLDLEWDEPALIQQADIDTAVTVGNGARHVVQREGRVPNELEGTVVTAEYRTPLAAHAHLEPQAALVDVQPDKVTAWVSTQSAEVVRDELAAVLGMDAEQVTVTSTYLGGGFGRKLNVEAAVEAARLSKAAGRPVHVGWNRAEDMRYGFFRPPTHHVLRGSLDANGRIETMVHEQASGDVLFSFFPGFLRFMFGADIGSYRGARIQYDAIPNRETVAYRIELPIKTGPWRGLGLLANTFAVESFMDELAHAAGADPVEFRLNHLGSSPRAERFKRVITAAAERAGWGTAIPEGRARGIATNIDANTVVAQVAEVSVDNGRIRVHNFVTALDPGLAINPDGIAAQTEGSVVMGLSSALREAITIKDGMVEASNFDRYPLLTMRDTPDMDVVILESGDSPYGMGEPPLGPVAAAVGNAVFALTGQRLRNLPMTLTS